jgi:hypothetical protein
MLPYRRNALLLAASLAAVSAAFSAASCGGSGSNGNGNPPGEDAGNPPPEQDGSMPSPDGSMPVADGAMPPQPDSGAGAKDAGMDVGPRWDGGFGGPLTCPAPGNYTHNGGSCGTERWSVKTGTDSVAPTISLLPQLSTIASLSAIPMPALGTNPPDTRVDQTEKTIFALKDVTLIFVRLETDSDYHLVVEDPQVHTMITEVPYPGCVSGGPWECNISRARAQVDAQFPGLVMGQGKNVDVPVSIIGAGFWDPEHGQFGVASNNLELHAILAICFGIGCDPTKS